MIKYRSHRGGLSDSMKTCKNFDNVAELLNYLVHDECLYWHRNIEDFSFSESYGCDSRINWNSWRYVYYNKKVIGMCDFGELDNLKETWKKHEYAEEEYDHLIPNYECPYCHSWRREETTYCPDCGRKILNDRDAKISYFAYRK